jgi:hypothetical protein
LCEIFLKYRTVSKLSAREGGAKCDREHTGDGQKDCFSRVALEKKEVVLFFNTPREAALPV